MQSKKKVSVQAISWEVQVLRLTSFVSSDAKMDAEEFWHKIVESPYKNKVEITEQIVLEDERDENSKISLRVNPLRVDWILQVNMPISFNPPKIETLGKFEKQISNIKKLSKAWFEMDNIPDIRRIAFGANLISHAPNRKDGYRKIMQFLPIKIQPNKMSDFLFRINIPTQSKIDGLRINRISKWQVLRVDAEIAETPSGMTKKLPSQVTSALELDINTDKERKKPISTDKLIKIFYEMIDEGLKISKHGI